MVHGLVGLVEQDLGRPASADRDGDAHARRDRVALLAAVRPAAQLGDDPGADVDRVQVARRRQARARRTRRRRCGRRCPSAAGSRPTGRRPVRSTVSPAACPRVSLTCLNRSRSTKNDARCTGRNASSARAPDRCGRRAGPVRQSGQRVVRRLLGECCLRVLQVGHPLGLGPAEPVDLPVLGLLRAQVGEREAGEIVAVHRRGVSSRPAPGPTTPSLSSEVELDGGAEAVRTDDLVQADRETARDERRQR